MVLVRWNNAVGFRADPLVVVGVVVEQDASWHFDGSDSASSFNFNFRLEVVRLGL